MVSGAFLSDTIASGERRVVNATAWIGALRSAIAMSDSSRPQRHISAVPLRTAWMAGADPRAVSTFTETPCFL